jgi:hypothetical protein
LWLQNSDFASEEISSSLLKNLPLATNATALNERGIPRHVVTGASANSSKARNVNIRLP